MPVAEPEVRRARQRALAPAVRPAYRGGMILLALLLLAAGAPTLGAGTAVTALMMGRSPCRQR